MSQAAPAKVCIRCGEDCSNRPRVKDKQGRYTCEACLAKAKAAVAAAAAPAPQASPVAEVDAPIPLLEDAAVDAGPRAAPCPGCGRPLWSDAKVCVGCGFNRETGRRLSVSTDVEGDGKRARKAKAAPSFTCEKCGYDLKGLKSTQCPECGSPIRIRSARRERELAESKRIAKMALIKPLVLAAVGLVLSALILVYRDAAAAIPIYLAGYGIGLVLLVVVYLFCSLVFIGFDEPFHHMVIRLAAVYALTDSVSLLLAPVPMGFGRLLLVGFIWVGLMVAIMEIDQEDAIIAGLILYVVKVVITMIIITQLG